MYDKVRVISLLIKSNNFEYFCSLRRRYFRVLKLKSLKNVRQTSDRYEQIIKNTRTLNFTQLYLIFQIIMSKFVTSLTNRSQSNEHFLNKIKISIQKNKLK